MVLLMLLVPPPLGALPVGPLEEEPPELLLLLLLPLELLELELLPDDDSLLFTILPLCFNDLIDNYEVP